MMNYKQAFFSKLEECYLGVRIKDFKSTSTNGFTNLLDIKAQYFKHIKSLLESKIDSKIESSDIYNKLYDFFSSFLNDTGTPFFYDTPAYKNIYAKVYTNSKDTSLFYKTQNLYYVKSDTLYQSLSIEEQGYIFNFDASSFTPNSDNNKSKLFLKLESISQNEEGKTQINIKVSNQKDLFPELNCVQKANSNELSEEFLKALKQANIRLNEEELKKILRSYRKQNEIDFFIHKNAKAFLEEQFDLWMFAYLYKDSAVQVWSKEAISRLQNLRNIAFEIIAHIAAFEDELKAIWLKPKFAKKTQYVFSLDVILTHAKDGTTLLQTLFKDAGFINQIKEWQDLNLIEEDFSLEVEYQGGGSFCYYELESYEEALANCEYVLDERHCEQGEAIHNKNLDYHESASADSRNDGQTKVEQERSILDENLPQREAANEAYKDIRRNEADLRRGELSLKDEPLIDYQKSRKLIKELSKGEIISLDMSGAYRKEFDIFLTLSNLLGWKIKRLFLDSEGIESCEFDNGKILNLNTLDLQKYPKLKNLIWWRE